MASNPAWRNESGLRSKSPRAGRILKVLVHCKAGLERWGSWSNLAVDRTALSAEEELYKHACTYTLSTAMVLGQTVQAQQSRLPH